MAELSIICLQFEPIHLQPLESIQKVTRMLQSYNNADIVVLPEMAFPGYSFNDLAEISPLLEEPVAGYPTFDWCSSQAIRLQAYVFCGYAEKCGERAYNAMMAISPTGSLIINYRKKFLYFPDKTWALEGEEYKTLEIVKNGSTYKVGVGICMDINPYEFTAPFRDYELASYWRDQDVDLCIFCTNWTRGDGDNSSIGLLNYWLSRMVPLLEREKNSYFIAADRIGLERGTGYMGTSCILKLGRNLKLLKALDDKSEGVLQYTLKL